ncbi:MAG: hypothetical protein QM666_05545 [Acinetobacter sp.]
MSFWKNLFNAQTQLNTHKNHAAYIANDCACKSNEQLLQALKTAQDEDVIKGIKQVLISRGFQRKELNHLHS